MKFVLKSYVPRSSVSINSADGQLRLKCSALSLLAAVTVVVAVLIGYSFFYQHSDNHDFPAFDKQKTESLAKLSKLQQVIASNSAELALRDSQITALKQQIHKDLLDQHMMQQRLNMFDDVLAARTIAGVHILHPQAHWSREKQRIDYQMVLVKGENYPRWALGHMQVSAHLPNGKIVTLATLKGATDIKYEFTTHLFMEGSLHWPEPAAPESLHLTLINHRDKKIRQIDIPVISTGLIDEMTQEDTHD